MTPDEQTDAIGECLPDLVEKVATGLWFYKWHADPVQKRFDPINDLNAMHEAEKALNDDQLHLYWCELWQVTQPEAEFDTVRHYFDFKDFDGFANADAPQRAEAFLKTIGKRK